MRTNKLPMNIFQREKELKVSKGLIIIGLGLVVLGWLFFLSYLASNKKIESTIQKEFRGTGNSQIQLNGCSFVINQPLNLQKQEEETKQEIQQPISPVEGKIIHQFGWRKEKQKEVEEWRYSPGLDWQVEGTQDVKAVLPGKVEAVEKRSDLGYTIIISHQQNLESLYGYCTGVTVKPGEEIKQGQSVAQIQDKFHFRMLKNNQPFDPKEYFVN